MNDPIVKRCASCDATYTASSWVVLHYVGVSELHRTELDDDGPPLELRNCSCGSTLAVRAPAAPTA